MNAFLFPGQGSQEVGMGKALYEEIPAAREILEKANSVLHFDILKTMFEGPEEKIMETQYAQPIIYTCSAMYLEKAKIEGLEFSHVAGHSLGEYSALYAAGVFSFEEGLKLVETRGKVMATQNGKGKMAAIIGLTESELITYLNPGVVMANLNTETQIVVSGTNQGIEQIVNDLSTNEKAKAIVLNVSAAFHSPQMKDAAIIMGEEINRADFKTPKAIVVSNVTGKPTDNVDAIKENLTAQITGQVRWYDSINALIKEGVNAFYEIGHGRVLRKMNKAISLVPPCLSI